MLKNEDNIAEYLRLNKIKGKVDPDVDPDIIAWYKVNGLNKVIEVLKDTKSQERMNQIKKNLNKIGRETLNIKSREDTVVKAIEEAINKKNGVVKLDGVEKLKTPEERQKEEQEYLQKIIKLHEEKMKTYKEQRRKEKLVPTEKELVFMVNLEQEIRHGKSEYEKKYGKEALSNLINKNFKEEKKQEAKIIEDHQKKIDELEELNRKLDETLTKIEALEYQMEHNQISIENYKKEKDGLQKSKLEILWDVNEMDPAILASEEKEFEENEKYKEVVFGENYVEEQKKNLNDGNRATYNNIENSKGNQEDKITENIEEIENRQQKAIDNKEVTIEKLKTKIANTEDPDKVIDMTKELVALNEDKERSIEQLEKATGKEDISYSELETPNKPLESLVEQYTEEIVDFKETIEETEELEKEIAPEKIKEESKFISEMQKLTYDPKDPRQCEVYLEKMRKINIEAKEYNKTLEESKSGQEIK